MKEIKASLGTFDTLSALEKFLLEDNERPYREPGYRRKLGIHKLRNAYVKEYDSKVWVYSQGYGIEYMFSEEEKKRRFD